MKFIIVFVTLFVFAIAAPPRPSNEVTLLRSESDVGPESFKYAYEISDGTNAQAQGQLKNIGTENEAIEVTGSYQFIGDDGQTYLITYIANENGFQPQGAHIPKV